jgi:hypothetical protein
LAGQGRAGPSEAGLPGAGNQVHHYKKGGERDCFNATRGAYTPTAKVYAERVRSLVDKSPPWESIKPPVEGCWLFVNVRCQGVRMRIERAGSWWWELGQASATPARSAGSSETLNSHSTYNNITMNHDFESRGDFILTPSFRERPSKPRKRGAV